MQAIAGKQLIITSLHPPPPPSRRTLKNTFTETVFSYFQCKFHGQLFLVHIMVEAQAVADDLMAAIINTVALKLPEFSPDRIEYCFISVEAEFNLRVPAITQDQTRYSYVVAALKGQVMDRVIDTIRNPPAAGTHYQAIKDRLLTTFSRSHLERSKMLLDWPGMGDGTPSALLSKILACLPAGEDSEHILFKVLFLRQLPADAQDHLAYSTALTICVQAEQADAYFALSGTRLNQPSSLVGNVVAAIDHTHQKCGTKNNTRLCIYHAQYGIDARRCTQNNYLMAHIPPAKTWPAGNANASHQ